MRWKSLAEMSAGKSIVNRNPTGRRWTDGHGSKSVSSKEDSTIIVSYNAGR